MTGPLRGASRARPLRGRAVTRQGSLGRAGGCWVGGRILALTPELGAWAGRLLGTKVLTDCLCKGGGELDIVELFLDDYEGLEAVARFMGGELEPERRVASLEV